MQTATYYHLVNGEEFEQVGTEEFLNAGIANLNNHLADTRAMKEAARMGAKAFAALEALLPRY